MLTIFTKRLKIIFLEIILFLKGILPFNKSFFFFRVETVEVSMALSAIITAIFIIALTVLNRKKIFRIFRHRYLISKLPSLDEIAYPLIGHTYLLVGTPEEFFRTVMGMVRSFYKRSKEKIGVLWLGPVPVMTFIHPDSAEVVLKSSKHSIKSFVYDFLHPWLGTGLLTSHGEKWKQRRRLITPSFHFSILQDFLDVMNEQSQLFVRNLKNKVESDETYNVGRAITMCALDIICETAMGQSVNAQDDMDSDYVKALYR